MSYEVLMRLRNYILQLVGNTVVYLDARTHARTHAHYTVNLLSNKNSLYKSSLCETSLRHA